MGERGRFIGYGGREAGLWDTGEGQVYRIWGKEADTGEEQVYRIWQVYGIQGRGRSIGYGGEAGKL